MSENIKYNYTNIKQIYKQIYHDYEIINTFSENIEYKILYELITPFLI